jgi:hypothetical protein
VRDIRRGKLERFSVETLIRYLARMRQTVQLTVKPTWLVRVETQRAAAEARMAAGADGTGCRSAKP